MATYDTYGTLNLVGVVSLGLKTYSSIAVTDASGAGDSSTVLGDVAADRFTAPTGLFNTAVEYTYLGTMRDASGKAVGFVASSGLLSGLVYTVFLPSGVGSHAADADAAAAERCRRAVPMGLGEGCGG